ncbi:EthD family reductase [Nocardia sp. NEAU-G5]|uniref:EthD family reductase n=1 Tax=Nocardia albiluteola TaxID=2842303 RepID=A0ABS6BDG8_9NOCA|nr:EthD family reductase [Nocardia albiluteola]
MLWDTPSDTEAFDKHYREVHIPLCRQLPGLRRYTLSRNPNPIVGEPFYQVAELDWDNMTALREAFAGEIGLRTAADGLVLRSWSAQRSMAIELDVRYPVLSEG